MSRRLYVGNISFKATEDDVKNLFSQAGEVVSVKLMKDAATGRMRGFGFVEMASKEDAEKAKSQFNGNKFMDRNIIVNEAKPQERQDRGYTRGKSGDFSKGERRR